jgi:hypothetical protein
MVCRAFTICRLAGASRRDVFVCLIHELSNQCTSSFALFIMHGVGFRVSTGLVGPRTRGVRAGKDGLGNAPGGRSGEWSRSGPVPDLELRAPCCCSPGRKKNKSACQANFDLRYLRSKVALLPSLDDNFYCIAGKHSIMHRWKAKQYEQSRVEVVAHVTV